MATETSSSSQPKILAMYFQSNIQARGLPPSRQIASDRADMVQVDDGGFLIETKVGPKVVCYVPHSNVRCVIYQQQDG